MNPTFDPVPFTVVVSLPLDRTRVAPDARPVTAPPTVYVFVLQVSVTLFTFAERTVPLPELPVMVHVWLGLLGCVSTEMLYAAPLATGVGKANDPVVTVRVSLLSLFFRTTDPERPVIIPPTVKVLVEQLMTTPLTSDDLICAAAAR